MKMNSCAKSIVGLACIGISLVASATPETTGDLNPATCEKKLTLEEFRAIAFAKSPLLAEIDRDYTEQLAKAFQTEVFANPEVQVEQAFTRMNIGGANDSQSYITLGQQLRISNFGSKQKVASLLRKAGDTQKRIKLLELSQKLLVQYHTLYALQETARIIASAEQRSSKKVSLVKQGVSKGLLSLGDEKLFEGEKYRLRAQQKGIAASIAELETEISKYLGLSCSVTAIKPELLEDLPPPEVLLIKSRASDLAERTRLDLFDDLAAEESHLAELDGYPPVTPRLVYQHTNDGGDFLGLGVTVPLPFWDRNQAARMRTGAEQQVIKRKKTFFDEGGLEAQIRYLRNSAQNSKEQADIFAINVVPSFEGALQAQERQYESGKGNVLQVWQTLRALNDVQTQSLTHWLEAVTARVQLSILVGEEI